MTLQALGPRPVFVYVRPPAEIVKASRGVHRYSRRIVRHLWQFGTNYTLCGARWRLPAPDDESSICRTCESRAAAVVRRALAAG